jgi:YD repeat-containing protein
MNFLLRLLLVRKLIRLVVLFALGCFGMSTARATGSLAFYTSPSYSVGGSANWGGTLPVSFSIANFGSSASGAFSVGIYLSSTSTYNASTAYALAVGSSGIQYSNLNSNSYGSFSGNLQLPASIPAGLGSTTVGSTSTVYVIATISQNGVATQASSQITTTAADLVGYSGQGLGFGVQQTTSSWGAVIGLKWAIGNLAAGTAGPFTVNFYICETSAIGSGNVPSSHTYLLTSLKVNGGLPGGQVEESVNSSGVAGYGNIQLPSANPFGDNNTSFYIGMVVNPTTNNTLTPITESNYANDSDQGSGIDYAPITINPPQPQILLSGSNPAGSQNSLQFGNVSIGNSASQTITISDTGVANLNLNNVTATGPYSITSVVSSIQNLSSPYFPGVIAPDGQEDWVVAVKYTPTAASQQTGSVVITSNDPTTPTAAFALTGTGVAEPNLLFGNPVVSNSDNLIANYGPVSDNGSATETFTVTNNGTAPLTIGQNGVSLTSTQSGVWSIASITSSIQGAINLSSAGSSIAANSSEVWSVVVKFIPTTTQGYSIGLQIFSNDPSTPTTAGAPTMTCALQGQGVLPMTLAVTSAVNGVTDGNPLTMNFGSVHATGQQQVHGTVTLTNTGQMPLIISQGGITIASGTNFEITSITSSTQGAISLASGSGTIAAASAETWTINLTFLPTSAGNDSTTLGILSNDPAHGTESVALDGTGLNQPGIQVMTANGGLNLPFGAVLNDGAGNHVGTQTFTIQNIGLQPMVVGQNGITSTSGQFSVQSISSSTHGAVNLATGSATIAASETEVWTVTIAFDPVANSSYTGTLNIASNDPVTPTEPLALSGSGTVPTLTLQPAISSTPVLTIEAGQVYNITWTAADTSDTAPTATIILSTSASNSLPASGLTQIASIPYSATNQSYAWRPSSSMVGQTVYIYANFQDQGVAANSYSMQKVYVDAAQSFNPLTPLTTTTSTYVYSYLYDGKIYGGSATLQAGNNVINVTTPLSGGGSVVHQITVQESPSLLATQGYTYDSLNRIKTFTNGNGVTTTYTYDMPGNLIQLSASNGDVVNFTYDSINRRTSMVDSTGSTLYGYDDLDRLTTLTYSISGKANDPTNLVLAFQYDPTNQETGETYPGGEQVTYGYDNGGRLSTITDAISAQRTFTTQYTYNTTTGQLTKLTRANGVVTIYGYDAGGRLNDIKHVSASNQTLAEYAYTLNSNGDATAVLTTYANETQKQTLYTYDSLRRLVQATYGAGATAAPNTDPTVTYTYDGTGNRLTEKTTASGTPTQTLTYSYGTANRLVQIVDQNNSQVASFVYDQAGNRIEKITPTGNTYYVYDERNLMTSKLTPAHFYQYTYNGKAQRVSQSVDGVATKYLVDDTITVFQTAQEITNGVSTNHIYGASERLQSNPSSGNSVFYLPDRLNSVRVTTDPTGNVTGSADYDAFGAVLSSN